MKTVDTKQKLFEMMQKVNPDFVINEANILTGAIGAGKNVVDAGKNVARNAAIDKKLGQNFSLETYGDLKKLINVITGTKKGEIVGAKMAGAGVDAAMSLVPGLGAAKSLAGIVQSMYSAPDTQKTHTWLDRLNIDDDLSKIVDDTVVNGFLVDLTKEISNRADTDRLEPNFDINAKMNAYLQKLYHQRAVSGVPPPTR